MSDFGEAPEAPSTPSPPLGQKMALQPKAQVSAQPHAAAEPKKAGSPRHPGTDAVPPKANFPGGDELAVGVRQQLSAILDKLDLLTEKVDKCLDANIMRASPRRWDCSAGESAADSEGGHVNGNFGSCSSTLTGERPKHRISRKPAEKTLPADTAVAPPPPTQDAQLIAAAIQDLDHKVLDYIQASHVHIRRDDVVARALRGGSLQRNEERKGTFTGQGPCARSEDRKGTWTSSRTEERMATPIKMVPLQDVQNPVIVNGAKQNSDDSSKADPSGSAKRTSESSGNTHTSRSTAGKAATPGTTAKDCAICFPSETSKVSRVSGTSKSTAGPTKVINDAMRKYKHKREAVVSTHIRVRSLFATQVWQFFEDSESSYAAFLYSTMSPMLVVASVFLTVLLNVETETTTLISNDTGAIIEIATESLYFLEFSIRFCVCPNRLAFILVYNNIIDIMSFLPFFLRATEGFVLPDRTSTKIVPSILFGAVPAIRLLKVLRYFPTFRLLMRAFVLAAEALPVMLYTLAIMGLVFSSLIYFVEDRSNVETLPRAMWLMIVTMTTVGYGDMTPQTTAGTCLVAIMAISSVLYMAIPLGLMGNAFSEVWGERHKILLCQRARYCLTQWGYTADTISGLFMDYDSNGDGELNLTEFRIMMNDMRVGLPDKAITKLFETFDSDMSGFVTDVEFVKAIFPAEYQELYANAVDETRHSIISIGTPTPNA